MEGTTRPLAVVTGASSGIGLHLALEAAARGYDLILAADETLHDAEAAARTLGARVESVVCDLASADGVDQLYSKVGTEEHKADPGEVARTGFDAMERGEAGVVAGLSNKLRVALANLIPNTTLAEQHRKTAEPGSARHSRH